MRIVAAVLLAGALACAGCASIVKSQPVTTQSLPALPACLVAKYYAPPVPFDPGGRTSPDPQYMSPIPSSPITTTDQTVVPLLAAALSLADQKFIHRLCHDLTWLLVDTQDKKGVDGVYAFWQPKAPAYPKPVRFISIPLGVFTSPLTYSQYEADLLNSLINIPTYKITASVSSNDDAATALLAMIAHEEGHIIWQRHLRKHNADNHKKCESGQVDYDDYTWLPANIPLYHNFQKDVSATHANGIDDPYPMDINPLNANTLMVRLYKTNTNFASLFAALAPDEDAAEAYKYHVLRKIPSGIGLTLNLPGTGIPIPALANLGTGKNAQKDACLSSHEDDDS